MTKKSNWFDNYFKEVGNVVALIFTLIIYLGMGLTIIVTLPFYLFGKLIKFVRKFRKWN